MRGKTNEVSVADCVAVLDVMAPPRLAQSWDNVGLLAGDGAGRCRRVLLCIDMTAAVVDEAIQGKCDLIVSYHPPLFRPVGRLLADSGGTDALVFRAIAAGIGIYSSHTALDAAEGGTNDCMANLCGLADPEPFEHTMPGTWSYKLAVFVPEPDAERLASALFAAGAGRIGDYEQCSFRLRGEGTFFGNESTNPQVGSKCQLERVAEVKIETVVLPDRLAEVVAALRANHPYEEPAFDIYPLSIEPQVGIGRVGNLPAPIALQSLARRLRKATGSKVVSLVGRGDAKVQRVAVCVGAAGRLPLEKKRSASCDVIVTGEIRHHDALTILRQGKTAIALGHWESERPVLPIVAERLRTALKQVDVQISQQDRPPFVPL